MTTESDVQANVLIDVSQRDDCALVRNNCGGALIGKHWVDFGVFSPGGSDTLGWRSIVVTPDMVGSRVAIFVAIEIKKPRKGVTKKHQKAFIAKAKAAGALAGVARSVAEALAILGIEP